MVSSRDTSALSAASEARQHPVGSEWIESHRLFVVDRQNELAVAMAVSIHVDGTREAASFHCAVFSDERQPIVIAEREIEVPSNLWEFRTSGLWVDTICETPYRHWSYGLEAFGLAIDDPTEMLGRGYGDRVPLGWELDFESSPDLTEQVRDDAFSQPGQVHGLLLFGSGPQAISGTAVRQHRWGTPGDRSALDVLDQSANRITDPSFGTSLLSTTLLDDPADSVALPVDEGRVEAQWWLHQTGAGPEAGINSSIVRRQS